MGRKLSSPGARAAGGKAVVGMLGWAADLPGFGVFPSMFFMT